ncbi:SMI1/KNR4 family protein [Microbulbifer sp. MLAF003]|uniref:SMI1/KNR4 family protein n=1 Tax=unclassified Microbulbifer TaxID=2619833 RepID=UPI0024ACE2E4|nr:SMI1/KNR4 family protein [Microbulbifer sp. MLAF003]WHI49420.1 SMI1/KNR4 family protein [Microbulbifer sp. MLAF003]
MKGFNMGLSAKLSEYAAALASSRYRFDPNEFGSDLQAICEVEKSIGLKFPAAYVDFLSVFGRGPKWLDELRGFQLIDELVKFQEEVREELEEEGDSDKLPGSSFVFRCIDGAELLFFECGGDANPIVHEISYGRDGAEVNPTGETLEEYIEIAIRDLVREANVDPKKYIHLFPYL